MGAEARNKIIEMAKKIVQDHNDGKAFYSQTYRTTDYTKPVYGYDKRISQDKIPGYDCSSFVSCCYNNAGLKEITNKRTIELYAYAQSKKNSGAMVWDANKDSISKAKPGDIIVTKGKGHTAVYIGNNQFAHSSTDRRGAGEQIRIDDAERIFKYSIQDGVFLRAADLVKADEVASNSGANVVLEGGKIKIDGKEHETLGVFKKAKCTNYDGGAGYHGGGGSYAGGGIRYKDVFTGQMKTIPKNEGANRSKVAYVASHNLPYGTQLFVPELKEAGLGNGILVVADTGGHGIEFDINMSNSQGQK